MHTHIYNVHNMLFRNWVELPCLQNSKWIRDAFAAKLHNIIKQTKRTTFSREYLHKTMLSMPTIYSISHQKSHLSHWCAIFIRIIITNSRVCIGGTVRFAVALNKRANFKHPKHNSNFEFGYIYNRDDGISISPMSYMSFYFKLFDSFA